MMNIIERFELEFDEHTGKALLHKSEVLQIQSELDRLRQQNAELAGLLKKHESRIRYAHEIGSEVMLYGDDLEEILATLAKYDQPEPEHTKA